ncbi:MAG: GNAT family N-acetyltransferase [Anaerolineae bacterium]|nr:GNAT family N-acetyltransferase [Anaerolineae bacterium]
MLIRTIRWPDERENILDHIRQVHGSDEQDLWDTWYGSMPGFDPADCFVIDGEQDGQIAAHAMIIPRQMQIGESSLPVGEIALVGVLEPYRRQGYAHALLDAAHDRMTARDDALGMLFGNPTFHAHWQYEYGVGLYLTSYESDILTAHALKAGRWNREHSYERRTADRLGTHSQPVTVRRFYTSDLPAVQALYATESARGTYMMARDDAVWTWQLDYMAQIGRYEPDDFLVAEVDNRLVAYARLVTQSPVNWFRGREAAGFSVIEAAGDHPDAVEALLGEVGRIAQTLNAERIGLFVHPESAFMRHALARGASLRDFTGAGYVRLHHLGQTLDRLVPTLETRRLNSRYAMRPYRLVVRTEHEQAEVYLGLGEPETVELEAPSISLVRLITGWYGIDHLSAGYHERYADLLRVLFPRRDPKIALADLM